MVLAEHVVHTKVLHADVAPQRLHEVVPVVETTFLPASFSTASMPEAVLTATRVSSTYVVYEKATSRCRTNVLGRGAALDGSIVRSRAAEYDSWAVTPMI